MITLVIDIGNTSTKLACFDKDNIIKAFRVEDQSETEDYVLKLLPYQPQQIILSSVKKNNAAFQKMLNSLGIEVINFKSFKNFPLINKYESTETLGNDRLANAIAAAVQFKNMPCLVIDAGTCLKFDFVNHFGEYIGGSIAPGIMMRFKALHEFTDGLPLLQPVDQYYLIGRNTQESIRSGVLNGSIAEVKGIIEQYQMAQKNLKVVLTGGDYLLFERNLKISIFADPYFTLRGLNEAAKFQKAQATDA